MRRPVRWSLSASLFLLACGGSAAPPSVPQALVVPAPPAPHEAVGKRSTPSSASAFAPVRDRVLDELLAADPRTARDLGLHDYDGKVAPVSKEALTTEVQLLQAAATDLDAVDPAGLTEDEALDRAELRGWVARELFWRVDVDAPRKRPQFYQDLFAVDVYMDRDYAPLEERARRLADQEEAALAQVGHVRENLSPPLSRPVTEVAARNFAGFATYLRGDVARVMGKAGDEAQRRRFARVNEALAKAADETAAWLKREVARGDQSHVLGPERYAKLLRAQEGLDLPLAEFERMNEENLQANRKAYEALAATTKDRMVEEKTYFATAGRMMKDARDFVASHRIVTLATDDAPVVRETPPYERWNSASLDVSGPFEAVRSAFFQLTIPDAKMPAKERQAYLGTLGDLLGTTIHEVYPGHFVQGRWMERAPTRVQKASGSYSFIEGWAHYAEQMMIDEGLGADDPANKLAMLHGALLRNCRFAVSVGIHTKGMTVEQAEKRFMNDCHQDAATAREQAVRGTFDPGYFAYTLGKLQILALREDAKKALGQRFSLQRFHDALLSHGAPPVALVHDRVLRDLQAER